MHGNMMQHAWEHDATHRNTAGYPKTKEHVHHDAMCIHTRRYASQHKSVPHETTRYATTLCDVQQPAVHHNAIRHSKRHILSCIISMPQCTTHNNENDATQ